MGRATLPEVSSLLSLAGVSWLIRLFSVNYQMSRLAVADGLWHIVSAVDLARRSRPARGAQTEECLNGDLLRPRYQHEAHSSISDRTVVLDLALRESRRGVKAVARDSDDRCDASTARAAASGDGTSYERRSCCVM
jgi:hypothetical protein